jgi:hypothetical protein
MAGVATLCLAACGLGGFVFVMGFLATPSGPPPPPHDVAQRLYNEDAARNSESQNNIDDYRHVLAGLWTRCTQDMDQLAALTDQTIAHIGAQPFEPGRWPAKDRLDVLNRVSRTPSADGKQDCAPLFASVEDPDR